MKLVLTLLVSIIIGPVSLAAEADSIVNYVEIGRYDLYSVEPEKYAIEQYKVQSNENRVYIVTIRPSHCRRGIHLYYEQALDSIPAIHGYELVFTTPDSFSPRGYIFRTDNGYLLEYMKDFQGCVAKYIKAEIQGEEYLSAIHEALDILSRFTLKEEYVGKSFLLTE